MTTNEEALTRHFAEGEDPRVCTCLSLGHDALRAFVRGSAARSVHELLDELGACPRSGCQRCRAAIQYYGRSAYPGDFVEESSALVPNERLRANVQKDGTCSVVPRIFGGQPTPTQLRVLADVAERYGARQLKITGGQRIDLLGIERAKLPDVFRDLGEAGFVSGHAYARGVRTVKTCVGDTWCRYGVGDAARVGIELEETCWGSPTPHKVKMGVSGCNRNCAEATIKDVGLVSVDGAWDVYVGGTAGMRVRAADKLCRAGSEREVLEYVAAFLQLYREEGRYLERTAAFVERVGIDYVRTCVVQDAALRSSLFLRFEKSQRHEQRDPWFATRRRAAAVES